ncbi:IclR family transcriptional regulator [Nitratireductor indicus C115]|uniref:IclR family transcriptional regulator n=1 Tax=Nitratireductor indicus C115 TaxID=1231190 RepID=K2P555_9HYPH|nr:IclR family transcriptional regulator C-terminal domain-containing protein [Nitratireductor indicus]EKF42491.1 IclR family transcriptional regulator [Nitratireductor indicus C115]SFQ56560.1 transcriptional regulator, IclR family [Nitratireductor indicus]
MEIESESNTVSDHNRDLVGALQKGLSVLEILSRAPNSPSGMTLTEVAVEAGLPRAGARRLLLTLVASGYARQEERRFVLSTKLLSLTRSWMGEASVWRYAEPIMQALSARLGESCSAAVLEGDHIVYVARAASRRILSVALYVGARLPAHCTSMGRVLLSDLDSTELARFLAHASIGAKTAKTVTDRAILAAKMAETRERGYAIVDEELELGLRSIAVPVRDRSGKVVAALNVSTQTARFTCAEMEQTILAPLLEAAGEIEDFLTLQ